MEIPLISKILKLREYVTPDEAARHLTKILEEEVTEAVVVELMTAGRLPNSIVLSSVDGYLELKNSPAGSPDIYLTGAYPLASDTRKGKRGGTRVLLEDGAIAECGGIRVDQALERPVIRTCDLLQFAESLLTPIEQPARKNAKSAATKRLRSALVMAAALAKNPRIDLEQRGAAQRIQEWTEDMGTPLDHGTISSLLEEIPDALESRSR